jgi:predicted GNAT superfamily acetyltransferase
MRAGADIKKARPSVKIKPLRHQAEFEQCVAIQKEVWQLEDIEVTPVHQFCIGVKTGAILLGAFLDEQMIGFVYSFPSIYQGKLSHHSHQLAVRPEFQGLGIGKKLKWAQRSQALKLGLELITWTVDPLKARNANLNLHSLGAITRTYWDNFYGFSPSLTLGPNIPTDRFLMEWWLKSPRVIKRIRGTPQINYQPAHFPKAVEGELANGDKLRPSRLKLNLKEDLILVELPRDIKAYRQEPALISSWQEALRKVFKHYFRAGYAVSDFIFGPRCFYVLEKISRLKDLKLK